MLRGASVVDCTKDTSKMENLGKIGELDIGLKWTFGIAAAVAGASAITLPTSKEQDRAALDLFDRPMSKLSPQEKKVAEFQAGHGRWKNFWENNVYPMTRKLPGAQNPILNPYRGLEPLGGGAAEDDE